MQPIHRNSSFLIKLLFTIALSVAAAITPSPSFSVPVVNLTEDFIATPTALVAEAEDLFGVTIPPIDATPIPNESPSVEGSPPTEETANLTPDAAEPSPDVHSNPEVIPTVVGPQATVTPSPLASTVPSVSPSPAPLPPLLTGPLTVGEEEVIDLPSAINEPVIVPASASATPAESLNANELPEIPALTSTPEPLISPEQTSGVSGNATPDALLPTDEAPEITTSAPVEPAIVTPEVSMPPVIMTPDFAGPSPPAAGVLPTTSVSVIDKPLLFTPAAMPTPDIVIAPLETAIPIPSGSSFPSLSILPTASLLPSASPSSGALNSILPGGIPPVFAPSPDFLEITEEPSVSDIADSLLSVTPSIIVPTQFPTSTSMEGTTTPEALMTPEVEITPVESMDTVVFESFSPSPPVLQPPTASASPSATVTASPSVSSSEAPSPTSTRSAALTGPLTITFTPEPSSSDAPLPVNGAQIPDSSPSPSFGDAGTRGEVTPEPSMNPEMGVSPERSGIDEPSPSPEIDLGKIDLPGSPNSFQDNSTSSMTPSVSMAPMPRHSSSSMMPLPSVSASQAAAMQSASMTPMPSLPPWESLTPIPTFTLDVLEPSSSSLPSESASPSPMASMSPMETSEPTESATLMPNVTDTIPSLGGAGTTSEACASAWRACKLRFTSDSTGPSTFDVNEARPDTAFSTALRGVTTANTNGLVPDVVADDGSATFITALDATPPFVNTSIKPFGNRVGKQTLKGNQPDILEGRCLRVFFTALQMNDGTNQHFQAKEAANCAVFRVM